MEKNTFILIHGAWHSRKCWDAVVTLLVRSGQKVIAPDLPGHGDDKTPFKTITLNSYISHIKELVLAEKQPPILVGHSMAGIILSQLGAEIPNNIAKLIYMAAFIPKHNESLLDIASQAESKGISTEINFNEHKKAIEIKHSKLVQNIFYNTTSPALAKAALAQLAPEPMQPFFDKLNLINQDFNKVKKCYIKCTKDKAITPKDQKRMYQDIIKELITLECDHSPFLSCPDKLVKALLDTVKDK